MQRQHSTQTSVTAQHFVIYCAMGGSLANPLWHACLLLCEAPPGQKIEVKHAWGFYPAPSSKPRTIVNKGLNFVKGMLGFNFDLQGNYGELKQEEMRYLDQGHGLKGVTFGISALQYEKLKQICAARMDLQQQAITEAKQLLTAENHQPDSLEIFEAEKQKAQNEKRASRLTPFDFKVSLTVDDGMGMDVSLGKSYTCKTMAIQLLSEIGIPVDYLNRITLNATSIALPRMSGELEDLYIHSTGPRFEFKSERSGDVTFFRQWNVKKNEFFPVDRIFLTLAPQLILADKSEPVLVVDTNNATYSDFAPTAAVSNTNKANIEPHTYLLQGDYVQEIKRCISQLQRIERVILNAKLTNTDDEKYRYQLLNVIVEKYRAFATMNNTTKTSVIEAKIEEAKDLLNGLYFAINDQWEVDESENDEYPGDAIVETIAARLPRQDQKEICKILGRWMVREPDPVLDPTPTAAPSPRR